MSPISAFLPKEPDATDRSAMRRRLPYVAGMDLLLLLFFPFSAYLRLMSDAAVYRAFFLAICATEAFFVLSLVLLKAGRSKAASYVGSLGILVNVVLMAFLTPFTGWLDIYRIGVYLLSAVVANALVSLERRQVLVYLGASLAVYAAIILLVAAPKLGPPKGDGLSTTLLFLVLFATINGIVLLMNDLNAKLIRLAEAEGSANRERAESLRSLIGSVSGALDTGRELVAAAGEGRSRSSEIHERLSALRREALTLEGESAAVDAKSSAALERVAEAKAAVENQNAMIVDSGAAVERISHAIQDLSAMAGSRRASISEVATLAERQGGEMRGLLQGIDRIIASSEAVMAATGGIIDVSEKTQLLAMNASIEAAHAGASGKGFAVIAAEIRKLSQETQESTTRIGEAIKANEATVRDQAAAIGRFTQGMDKMTADVRSTFEALGAMVDELVGMETATGDLGESTMSMLRLAGETKSSVGGVVEGLRSGAASAESAKDFASRLSAELSRMLEAFAVMDKAIEKASLIGERNLARVAELEAGLASAERGSRA